MEIQVRQTDTGRHLLVPFVDETGTDPIAHVEFFSLRGERRVNTILYGADLDPDKRVGENVIDKYFDQVKSAVCNGARPFCLPFLDSGKPGEKTILARSFNMTKHSDSGAMVLLSESKCGEEIIPVGAFILNEKDLAYLAGIFLFASQEL